MKQLRIFFIISCFVMAVYFLIFSFSGISIAKQTSLKDCISNCSQKQQICSNINADKRICEVEFKSCVDTCKSEKESPSSPQQESSSTMKPM